MRSRRNRDHCGGSRYRQCDLRCHRRAHPADSIHTGTCEGSVDRSKLAARHGKLEIIDAQLLLVLLCALCDLCVEILSFFSPAAIRHTLRGQQSKSRFAGSLPRADIVREESLHQVLAFPGPRGIFIFMIQLSSAGKHFGSKTLFEGLNWVVNDGDRVGLVGGNGTGKSTLLKVLAGMETLDDGSFFASKGATTGYLPQDGMSLSGRTVMEECLSVYGHLLEIETEKETLTHLMAETDPKSDEYQKITERYHRIETEFQHQDGYALEAQAGEVLGGLGFSREDANRRAEEFSGGWQMRLGLAKLLLTKPHLLLLDEPTNHLDLEARNWLEQYLQEYPFAFVVVSHDRYFLDIAVNRILEIWNKRTYFYTGNYDRYL